MTAGKQFRQDARAAERQQRKWAARLHRDFLRRQQVLVVPRAHEDHMNRQGVLAAIARPDPLLEAPVQGRPPPIALPEPVPMPVVEVPPQIVTVPALTVQIMPVPPVALPTTPMSALQTQTPPTQPQRQLRYNPTAAEYIPPSVLLEWQQDEAEFNKQLEWATGFGADLQNLRDRSSELNHRSTLLIPNSEEHQLDYEDSAAFFNWFKEHCNAGLYHVGIHLDQLRKLPGKKRAAKAEEIVANLVEYFPDHEYRVQIFHSHADLVVVGEETKNFNIRYPRLCLTAANFADEYGPANLLSPEQLRQVNEKLEGDAVVKWVHQGLPSTRKVSLNKVVTRQILMPRKLKYFHWELSGEIFCDWISASQDHAPKIQEIKDIINWLKKNDNKGPHGFVETDSHGKIVLNHPNVTFRFLLNSTRKLLITAYK